MGTLFRIFFRLADPFVRNPAMAILVAAGFAILWGISFLRSGRLKWGLHSMLLLTTVLWIAFALSEFRFQGVSNPIRVDLLLIWPVLFVISAASAWFGLRGISRSKEG